MISWDKKKQGMAQTWIGKKIQNSCGFYVEMKRNPSNTLQVLTVLKTKLMQRI